MELESFAALDERVTKEDWEQTPANVRELLRWLFESYESRIAEFETEKALSKVEGAPLIEVGTNAPVSLVGLKEASCSFCGKRQKEVTKLIAGPSVRICNECVEVCDAILDEKAQ